MAHPGPGGGGPRSLGGMLERTEAVSNVSFKTEVGRSSMGPGRSRAHRQAQEPLSRSSSELWCTPEVGVEAKTNTLM